MRKPKASQRDGRLFAPDDCVERSPAAQSSVASAETSIGKVYLRSGEREQISNAHWVRSSLMKVAISSLRKDRRSKLAGLCALLAVMSGCQRNAQNPFEISGTCSPSGSEFVRISGRSALFSFYRALRTGGSVVQVFGLRNKHSTGSRRRRPSTGCRHGRLCVRGAVLAQIRQQDLKNQLDQAEAQVSQATAQHVQAGQDYERAKALYATQSLTRPDFDQAQAKFASTLAVVNQTNAVFHQAQLALNDSDLKAPFSGYILTRNIELGN